MTTQNTAGLTKAEIVTGFEQLELKKGDVVLVHSAMRTFGHIEGGADAVVDAFLEVLGEEGTLVVPTFSYVHEIEDDPIIDMATEPSEMGIITRTALKHPESHRSVAFRHSLTAIGRQSRVITEVDPTLSEFDPRSSFGVLVSLNAKIVLLGVTYSSSTTFHLAEYISRVPYRHLLERNVRIRQKDGRLVHQTIIDYQPFSYPGDRSPDYNRLGKIVEGDGRVKVAAIGNCAVRCYNLRQMLDFTKEQLEKDCFALQTPDGESGTFTQLDFGTIVLSPEFADGAGRPGQIQWCVMDESKLTMPDK